MWCVLTIIGPFVYIASPKTWCSVGRGFGKYNVKFIDNVWGNRDDGLSGDEPFRTNEANKYKFRWLSSLVWSCFRNPVGNGKRSFFSASGLVSNVDTTNNLKIVTMENGSNWFFYNPTYKSGVLKGIELKIGWKLREDVEVGKHYEAKLGFSACKPK